MKIILLHNEQRFDCSAVADESFVTVTGYTCPCGEKTWRISGGQSQISDDDRAYEASARSLCCNRIVGVLRVEMDTLFGLREDQAVLSGRCRVY